MKVLSIEQMNKLKELGVDVSNASMAIYNIYAGEKKEYDILSSNGAFPEKQEYDRFGYGIHNIVAFDKKPVFTLQDIIELLPYTFNNNYLRIYRSISIYYFIYENMNLEDDILEKGRNPLEAAYNMLIWVIENGYLKTK